MKPIRKFWQLKSEDASINDTGTLAGNASVMGNLDSADDVIFPGAYKDALAAFRTEGLVLVGHDWDDMPIAMPTLIEERGAALYSESTFHSTEKAQEVRAVCVERLSNGFSVGLSVGFLCAPDSYQIFESGAKLLEFARSNGYDISLFDASGIAAHEGWCRAILRVDRLIEYSIVPVPANGRAQAIAAKSASADGLTPRDIEQSLCDAGLSRREAKTAIANWKTALRDAGQEPTTQDADAQGTPPPNDTNLDSAHSEAQERYIALSARALAARHRLYAGAQ